MSHDYLHNGGSFGEELYAAEDTLNPANPITPEPTDQTSNPQRRGYPSAIDGDNFIYNSYAGVDIVASMLIPNEAPISLGELQTISYSVHRENSPVRTLGHTAPISFISGGRTVAGSMIFTVFNNYAFYRFKHFQKAIEQGLYPIADMMPPMDIVLSFANEYGTFSKMKIFGVTFVDEGGAMSIDDLISESTFTFMARGIQPMTGYRVPENQIGSN